MSVVKIVLKHSTGGNWERWQEFKSKLEETEMIYNFIDENMPEWARPTIQKIS